MDEKDKKINPKTGLPYPPLPNLYDPTKPIFELHLPEEAYDEDGEEIGPIPIIYGPLDGSDLEDEDEIVSEEETGNSNALEGKEDQK